MKQKNDWLEKLAEESEVKTKPAEGFYSIKEMAARLGKSATMVRCLVSDCATDFEMRTYKPAGSRFPSAYYRKVK
jgi:hypothetical protein